MPDLLAGCGYGCSLCAPPQSVATSTDIFLTLRRRVGLKAQRPTKTGRIARRKRRGAIRFGKLSALVAGAPA
ncbi:hypothetical protein KCP77_21540 [Salmonella enterica subsp. enterica]|nr:hypothetical protein KCP77_21540 [Salmonella enterica subsp. enterica]